MNEALWEPKPDPPVRRNGGCVTCGGPRLKGKGRYHQAEAALDAFCSTECARAWHGATLPPLKLGVAGPDITRQHTKAGGFQHGTVESYRLCACEACKAAMGAARGSR
jgi:hypothetical protein